MNFSEITIHLHNKGFASRKIWNNKRFVFVRADGIGYSANKCGYTDAQEERPPNKESWVMTLNDIGADDWETVPVFWENDQLDIALPFKFVAAQNRRQVETLKDRIPADIGCPDGSIEDMIDWMVYKIRAQSPQSQLCKACGHPKAQHPFPPKYDSLQRMDNYDIYDMERYGRCNGENEDGGLCNCKVFTMKNPGPIKNSIVEEE